MKVVEGLPAGWGVCSRTTLLSGFTRILSHHGNRVAVGSETGDIIILNVITGSQSAVFSDHTMRVSHVVFSSDGTLLVSASWDKTIKLWDAQTGGVAKTFFGHKGHVLCVSISVDSTTIASGSVDRTICLWNVRSGECCNTIQQQEYISHVMLSPTDPQHLMSISNQKVWQWGANSFQIRPPFDGSHAAFSSDGTQFVSCFKGTATVHNSSSGVIVTEFQAASNIRHCCFSPDNRLVAVAAGKKVYCWDITTSKPKQVETFIGHTGKITSLIFSSPSTLISASLDKSVKFWQIGAQSEDPAIIDLNPLSLPSAPIKSVVLQSKEGIAITCDSGGELKTWDISTGTCKTCQTIAKPNGVWDGQFVDGRLIFVGSRNRIIYAWDGENGRLLWKTDVPWSRVEDLKISGGGICVFGMYTPNIWAWSLQTGEVMEKMDIGYGGSKASLIVDGSKVWACWGESKYKGWDFGIPGSIPVELPNKPTLPGPSKLWDPKQARIKSPATGEVVLQLPRRFAGPVCVGYDNSYLIAAYQSGEILILDLTNVK